MARHAKTAVPADGGKAAPSKARAQAAFDPGTLGIGALREWLHQNMLLAQGIVSLLEQAQRINTEAITSWTQSLADAAREIDEAEDVGALLAVPAHAASRELDQSIRRLGESARQVLEAEMQWAERAREQALAMGGPWLRSMSEAGAAGAGNGRGNGADNAALQTLSDAQEAWLQMSQRWVDTMRANAPH